MPWLFLLFGFASLAGQILLLREILVIFHGTEISVGIFFGSWLAGIGLGASFGARIAKTHRKEPHDLFVHALAALGFSLMLQIVLIRCVPRLLGAFPAELAPLQGIIAAVPVGTFTTSFLTGFLFPVGCSTIGQAEGRTIGRLYAFEGLGGLIGGLAFTFFLARYVPPLRGAALLGLVLGAGALVHGMRRNLKKAQISAISLLIAGVVLLSPAGDSVIYRTMHFRWESLHPGLELVESRPTPYQQVEVARLGKQWSLFGNGTIVASFPDPHTAGRIAAMIMAQNPKAKRLLLIGGGIGSLVPSLLHYPIDRLAVIEPDPWALRIAKAHMPRELQAALDDPRVHIVFADGRFYVNRLPRNQYDVIACITPDPVSAFWNRYYTREFFRAASRALAPTGVFFTRVTSAENFWGSETASYAGSVYHTLRRVFPYVRGTPGDETLFFASNSPDAVNLDPQVLKARYATLGTTAFDPSGFETLLPPRRTAFVAKELQRSPDLINTDFNPVSTSLAMILWGRFSGSAHMEILSTMRRSGVMVYCIPILFFVIARLCFRVRWGPREDKDARFQALLAMAALGAGAMGIQIVLIYSYQSLFGYVFERIGLIAAIFMSGLVLGGFGGGELVARVREKRCLVVLALGLFIGLCMGTPICLKLLIGREPLQIEIAVFGMILASGILTGAAFPVVAARHLEMSRNAGETSGWTDAADHYGAAAGALITGTLLVPLLGMERACLVLAMVLSVPVILIASEFVFPKIEPFLQRYRPSAPPSFPYVRLTWLLGFSVAAAMAWHVLVGPPGKPTVVQFPTEVLRAVSGSEQFQFKGTPYPHYIGKSPGDQGVTVSLSTMPTAGDIRGYGGPINLLLSVSDRGTIRGLSMVDSRETPSYAKGMDTWFQRFKGLSILEPLGDRLDAVTGATITSRAVIKILDATGERISGPLLHLKRLAGAPETRKSGWSAARDFRLWAVILLMIFFSYAFYSRSRAVRSACLAASLIVLGIYLNAPFTSLDAAELLRGNIPAAGTLWRNVLFIGALVISVLWGQAFCGFLCPFGALQEFMSVNRLRVHASPRLEQGGRYLKFVLLAVLASIFLITDDTIWFGFSPLQHFFGNHSRNFFLGNMDSWILGLCVAVLAASIFYFRFWCRYLCPAGAFLALFNKVSLLWRWSPKPVPGLCDLGVTHPRDVDCIRCHRCLHRQKEHG